MRVTIHVYASLKDYFSPVFNLNLPERATLADVISEIISQKPESSDTVHSCRLAVNQNYVDQNYILQGNEEILLFPPSSGG
ncbi:MAG: MoaD/ThiS family protein [Spirochaetota bacterium]|nr:MoaD/ThiS family protein [Spirochaetota bacterium]